MKVSNPNIPIKQTKLKNIIFLIDKKKSKNKKKYTDSNRNKEAVIISLSFIINCSNIPPKIIFEISKKYFLNSV